MAKKVLKLFLLFFIFGFNINAHAIIVEENEQITEIQETIEEKTDKIDKKGITNPVLKPVGWAVGGAIAPVYLGVKYTDDALYWSGENIVAPTFKVIKKGSGKAIDVVAMSLNFGWDNVISPIGEGAIWGIEKTIKGADYALEYTMYPVFKYTYYTRKVISKAIDKTADYTIIPITKGGYNYVIKPIGIGTYKGLYYTTKTLAKGIDYGVKYSIVPIGKAGAWGIEKTAKGLIIGSKYTIAPIGKGLYYGADKTFDALSFGAKYTIYPVAKGIGMGAEAIGDSICWFGKKVITPSVSSTVDFISKAYSPIDEAINSMLFWKDAENN